MEKEAFIKKVHEMLVGVLREFGIAGLTVYVGGFIVFVMALFRSKPVTPTDLAALIVFLVVGCVFLGVAAYLSRTRTQARTERLRAVIEMTMETNNRLAEAARYLKYAGSVTEIMDAIKCSSENLFTLLKVLELEEK